jgi:Flp pilus assembly protein TadD/predicted Zn-dependent protease with MMP-like domain
MGSMRLRALSAAVWLATACRGTEPKLVERTPVTTEPEPGVAAAAATALIPSKPEPAHHHHPEPVVECPIAPSDNTDQDSRVGTLVDEANRQIERGAFAAAWTCADRAADLSPTSVEAHHLRGAALAALGRDNEAQIAYSIALALDPDDPETLRAVADFYINGKRERGRDALRLGLELAERGSRRAQARRRRNPPLAADLAVLEAQALNDLGRSDEALARVDAALKQSQGRGDALHERGVALFNLSRLPEAKTALLRALEVQPDDAYTHQMLGLTLEQLGDHAGAATELERARTLAPADLFAPVLISQVEFQKEIDAVVVSLPTERRAKVKSIRIEIADLPDREDLAAVHPPFPPTILGLYRGPVGRAAQLPPQPGDEPPSIVLYRKNLARAAKTRTELSEQIRDTLLHEIGHLEGLDEDDLRRRGME